MGRSNRPGRNDPCPCGSGKKFKKCHGAPGRNARTIAPDPTMIEAMTKKLEARELQRRTQQGLGKPIIAEKFKGYQFVCVGNTVHYGKWKTFHDFLLNYIKDVLGSEWGNAELREPLEKRHPILQWYDSICRYQRATIEVPGEVSTAPMTGAVSAYMGLSYNLYLLAHNVELRDRLVERLKIPSQFRGAYYETFVAACFILAGFELSLEDEDDPTVSHCEFVATSKATGKSYSVEAKSRAPGKTHTDIGTQLAAALRKEANHPRVVFIDVNIPHSSKNTPDELLKDLLPRIKRLEETLNIGGTPAPPAYLVVTNHPYHYDPEGTGTSRAVLGAGFKMPDFGYSAEFDSLVVAFKALQKHADIFSVVKSFAEYQIPSAFDGEIPEFAFGDAERRFTIGETYDLSEFEPGAIGDLTTGTVSEDGKTAHLAFHLQDGRSTIARVELTEAEASAYKQHPETFFGINLKPGGRAETPLDLFEFFYENHKSTPRGKMLEWFKDTKDFDDLAVLPQEELLLYFCERHVHAVMAKSSDSQP